MCGTMNVKKHVPAISNLCLDLVDIDKEILFYICLSIYSWQENSNV